MENKYRHCASLSYIIQDATNVSGEWDGDFAGQLEDRAHLADEIVSKAEELRKLIEELENI
jgi:hypothetical protein